MQATQTLLGLAKLMRLALGGEDLSAFGQSLLRRATENPSESAALMDAAIIFQCLGNPEMGLALQHEALKLSRHYRLPASLPTTLNVLALMAPGEMMANVPLECLLEDSDIALSLYYATTDPNALTEIPEHDLLFVAIGESEAGRQLLDAWIPRLAHWPRPFLNDPRRIPRVARDAAYARLHTLPGVGMPATHRVEAERLVAIADGACLNELPEFAWLLRPFDSHAGHGLVKIDDRAQLADRRERLTGDGFFVSSFVDYRSPDGLYRKYRVILIDGQPFAGHMGISEHWMIHYLNAGMADSTAKRAEEARFMARFDQDFARRHATALAAIHETIGLDYLGIDCAEDQDGRLLIFEVDPAMVVHAMDPIDVFPYKQPAMRRIFEAFRALLFKTAARQKTHPSQNPDA